MKLETPDIRSLTSDEFETMAMGVDARTAQVFFRDRMYTAEGKLRVIAQEYAANARDAHREVGKSDVAIQLSLPTTLDPQFVVRDFGMGISPERMANVFRIYGRSTKTKSDIENGGFGIGAKCAFSYASAFAVTTIHARTKYVYSMYIDDNAENQIALMYKGEAGADEPDGTEIKIPINADDIHRFTKWVHEVTHHWSPRPVFIGRESTYTDVDANVIHDTGPSWTLRTRHGISYLNDKAGIWVIADGVPYCVPQDDAASCSPDTGRLSTALNDLGLALVLPFKVGEIMLYPSREVLYYSAVTKHSIVSRVETVVADMVSRLQAKLDAATTVHEAVSLWWDTEAIVNLATKLSHPRYRGINILASQRTEDIGIEVVEAKIETRGPHDCVKDYSAVSQIWYKTLFEPKERCSRRKYILDPAAPMTLKEIKASLRAHGKGNVVVVAITDPEKAAKNVDYDGFRAAGFTVLSKPPKPPRRHVPAEAVFMVEHCARASTGSKTGVVVTNSKSRVYFENVARRRFVKVRRAEQLDDTVIAYADCGEVIGERHFDDAMRLAMMARVLHSGFRRLANRSITIDLAEWAPRFSRHADEDDITFLPDYLDEVRLEAEKLDDAGIRRLIYGGVCRNEFVAADRWFWRKGLDLSETSALAARTSVVDMLRESERFSDEFLSLAKLYLRCEDRDDDDCSDIGASFVTKYLAEVELVLGPNVMARVRSTMAKVHSVRDEFQSMFAVIPELPYFLEALTHSSLGDHQRGVSADLSFSDFIADIVASKYTPSSQFAAPPPAPVVQLDVADAVASEITPNQESIPAA